MELEKFARKCAYKSITFVKSYSIKDFMSGNVPNPKPRPIRRAQERFIRRLVEKERIPYSVMCIRAFGSTKDLQFLTFDQAHSIINAGLIIKHKRKSLQSPETVVHGEPW